MDIFLFYKILTTRLHDSELFANNAVQDKMKPLNLKVVTLVWSDVQSIDCIIYDVKSFDVVGVRQ